jgi:SAM-dependent methyltransferase
VTVINDSQAAEDLVAPTGKGRRRLPLPRGVKRRLRDLFFAFPPNRITAREDVARMWLEGSGIEIGALNTPLRVPPSVHVRYVDYLPIEELRQHHAHLLAVGSDLVAPDVVDDGERLSTFADESQDFVIANHFMEHSEDPIGTLAAHLRVIRPGGMLFHAVPDARRTFDWQRPVTPVEHLVRDHEEGPEASRQDHYREWAALVDKVAPEEVERHAAEIAARRFSIHFHVWTPAAYLEFLLHCQAVGLPLDLVFFRENDVELIAVMRRTRLQPTS